MLLTFAFELGKPLYYFPQVYCEKICGGCENPLSA